jgi:hypothetical protein
LSALPIDIRIEAVHHLCGTGKYLEGRQIWKPCKRSLLIFSKRAGAILHSLHRAIITSPTSVPDIVFSININDEPRANSWSFAASDDQFTPPNVWLMPHFSSWSWPVEYIGPLDEALTKIEQIEEDIPWNNKISKAVWRGTEWFDPDWDMGLRPKLVKITEGKKWANVQLWGQGHEAENNTIQIQDFCRYKYIIYAEVHTRSTRRLSVIMQLADSTTGKDVLRATPLPSSLRIHPPHSTTHVHASYIAPNSTTLLLSPPSLPDNASQSAPDKSYATSTELLSTPLYKHNLAALIPALSRERSLRKP